MMRHRISLTLYFTRYFSVNVTESGKQAILQLAGGDLRRVLNLLQSAHMAYPLVDEQAVYLTAGAAVPAVIEQMLQALLNESFDAAYESIHKVDF